MHRDPMDIFSEMDDIFARLFTRIDREFMSDVLPGNGYHIIIRDDGEWAVMLEERDDSLSFPGSASEPMAEVHRIGNEVKVIAALPGITEEALRLDVKGSTLIIDAGDADHAYRTSAVLPPVDTGSMQVTLKNGVLEVSFACLPMPSGKA